MQNQPTGYNANQTLVIKFPGATENYFKKLETFNSEIRTLPSVKASCMSGFIPGMEVNNYSQITRPDVENPKIQLVQFYTVDFDFISMYSLEMKAGRELSKLYGNDKEKLMINEEAVKFFGYSSAEEAIGKILVIDSEIPMEIAGVVRNFHQESLDKAFLSYCLYLSGNYLVASVEIYFGKGFRGNRKYYKGAFNQVEKDLPGIILTTLWMNFSISNTSRI